MHAAASAPYCPSLQLAPYCPSLQLATYCPSLQLAPCCPSLQLAPCCPSLQLAPYCPPLQLAPDSPTSPAFTPSQSSFPAHRPSLCCTCCRPRHSATTHAGIYLIAASCWVQVAGSPFASVIQLVDDLGAEFRLLSSVAQTVQAALLAIVKWRTGVDPSTATGSQSKRHKRTSLQGACWLRISDRQFAEASPMKHMVATHSTVIIGKY